MEKGRVFTGARCRFSIDGRKVGYATACSGSEEIRYDPLEVLDNIEVEEFVPIGYTVSFTSDHVRIVGTTIKSEGYFPKAGNTPDDHLKNILLQGDMVGALEDTKTERNIATIEQMKMASRNFTINARGMVGKSITYVATRIRDESGG
jgi:hypothetical protein